MKNRSISRRMLSMLFAVCILFASVCAFSSCDMYGSSYYEATVNEGFYKVYLDDDDWTSVSVAFSNTLLFPELYGLRTMEQEIMYFRVSKDSSYPRIQPTDDDGRYWEQYNKDTAPNIAAGSTLYARFTSRRYDLRFCKDEIHGTVCYESTVYFGSSIDYPTPEIPAGMVFVGWFNENYTVQYTDGTNPREGYEELNAAFFPNGATDVVRFRPRFAPET